MNSKKEYLESKVLIDKETGWRLVQRRVLEKIENSHDEVKPGVAGPYYVIPSSEEEITYYEYEISRPNDNGEYECVETGGSDSEIDEISFSKLIKRIQESEREYKEMEAEAEEWLNEQFPEVNEGKPPKEPLGLIRFNFAKMYAYLKLTLPINNVEQRRDGDLDYDFGGSITYKFGKKDSREYVIIHDQGSRMSETEIVARIYEDGEIEYLDIEECECKYCIDDYEEEEDETNE